MLGCLVLYTLRHPRAPLGWGNLHCSRPRPGEIVRCLQITYAFIDAPLGVGTWHPGPVRMLTPDLLHGHGNRVCHGGSPDPTLAAVATLLGENDDIEGHQSMLLGRDIQVRSYWTPGAYAPSIVREAQLLL